MYLYISKTGFHITKQTEYSKKHVGKSDMPTTRTLYTSAHMLIQSHHEILSHSQLKQQTSLRHS